MCRAEMRRRLTYDKWEPRSCAFNTGMQSPSPSDVQRAALQHFESAYEQWCDASQALAAAEYHLWTETLALADRAHLDHLAREVVRLRGVARHAYETLRPLLPTQD